MLEKLIEVIVQFWSIITPVFVVPEYEVGIVLRWGKYLRNTEPGLNKKCPIKDTYLTCDATIDTIHLPAQNLVTSDLKQIGISAVVEYRVADPKLYLLQVHHHIIHDITQRNIAKVVTDHSYGDLLEADRVILRKTKRELKEFGFEILDIAFANVGPTKTLRLLGVTHEQF